MKRMTTSQKNNVSFDYDAFGRRTAKHVLTSSNDLLSSTYYILDAQGNTMATYNLNIDTLNSSLAYYQAEKYIYGSSRLEMLKDSVNVLGSAFTNTDSTNVTHTLGNKRYELSNHLGNVLTVITDKPIPHNNGGTVDYWQASIASAYDYSPFGVMLTGRTFEGKQTICEDSTTLITQNTLQEGFNSWGSWTTMGSALLTYVSGEMQVSNPNTSKKDIGASKAFTTGTGLHNVSFEVIGNTCATVVIWPPSSTPIPIKVSVKDNYGNVVASGNYTTAGTYNLSFTPASSSATYSLEFHMTKASAFCFFRVDDVLVSYDDTTTVTVCKEVEDGYRYGYQGQERDDEIKGGGNSVNYTFRMHDTRLGRFFAVDPLAIQYPHNSPYAFSENRVIDALELEGLEKKVLNKNNFNRAIRFGNKTIYFPKHHKNTNIKLVHIKGADWENDKPTPPICFRKVDYQEIVNYQKITITTINKVGIVPIDDLGSSDQTTILKKEYYAEKPIVIKFNTFGAAEHLIIKNTSTNGILFDNKGEIGYYDNIEIPQGTNFEVTLYPKSSGQYSLDIFEAVYEKITTIKTYSKNGEIVSSKSSSSLTKETKVGTTRTSEVIETTQTKTKKESCNCNEEGAIPKK